MKSSGKNRFGGCQVLTTLFLLVLVLGAGTLFVMFFEGDKPVVDLHSPKAFLGKDGGITLQVRDSGSGLRTVAVSARQGNASTVLHREDFPRTSYRGAAGPLQWEKMIPFDVGKEGFKDGELQLTIEAVDFSWRGWLQGNTTVLTRTVIVDTVPPQLQLLHGQRYILPGGSGIAIYRLADTDSRHGVQINGRFHPGHPVGDGRDDTYISYFALPYDNHQIQMLQVEATDPAGNIAVVPFKAVVKKSNQKKDRITISDSFLDAKIPEFEQHYPQMTGNNLQKYLTVNQVMRVEDNTRISQLCTQPSPNRYWQGSFHRMPGSGRAGFADHRTYLYNSSVIDEQVHLGVDIASTRHAEVRAANTGLVIFAEYLGIYGNMIVVDHGQGIYSLYSHLSQMNVKPGDHIDQSSVLGMTGTSGMAGGDHLHFSMLVNGEFVTPVEWWDQNWLEVNIEEPLNDSKF